MKLPVFIVDAFAEESFEGNPAAVCPLNEWLPDATMQAIAAQHNLSETAFFVREAERYRLRWFTPTHEVELCGHATLASAWVLHRELKAGTDFSFDTRSGLLDAKIHDQSVRLELPLDPVKVLEDLPEALIKGLAVPVSEVYTGSNYLVLLDSAQDLKVLKPDLQLLATLGTKCVIVTAKGSDGVDFVSRFFAPQYGIDEDPVTGSAHCALAPFWAERLGKTELVAKQLSVRGGVVCCEVRDNCVELEGKARTYLRGEIEV